MKETFTYREIQDASQVVKQLGAITVSQKTAYRLSRIMAKINSLGKDVGKAQLEIYKLHGYQEKPGASWSVKSDNMETFIKAMDDLMDNTTVDVEFMPVGCNMFPQLTAESIVGMGKFMTEEEKIISLT